MDVGGGLLADSGGSGPPLILIHGWALDRRMWGAQRRAFRRHFTTISYDRRGFGESGSAPDAGKELEDLDALIGALHLGRTALLGMSQGGRVALRYALAHPDKVSALVLQGAPIEPTPPPAGDPAYLPVREYAELLARGKIAEMRRAIAAHPLMDVPAEHTGAHASLLRMINGYRGEDLPGAGAQNPNTFEDLRGRLSQIKAPALVLTGTGETAWLIAAGDRLAASIPNAQRAVIQGGGHLVNMTAARVFNRVVISFLKTATQGPAFKAPRNL
jgi:pimeloyl-ACP methyl ester carboxylesterase